MCVTVRMCRGPWQLRTRSRRSEGLYCTSHGHLPAIIAVPRLHLPICTCTMLGSQESGAADHDCEYLWLHKARLLSRWCTAICVMLILNSERLCIV